MPLYIITYELRGERSYKSLLVQLKAWQCSILLEGIWLARLRGPTLILRSELQKHLNEDDGLVVMELRPDFDWALSHAYAAGVRWITNHSPPQGSAVRTSSDVKIPNLIHGVPLLDGPQDE